MSSEFVIRKKRNESEAIIFLGKEVIAKIKKDEGFTFKLVSFRDKQEWVLSNIVDGQRRPFSYAVRKTIESNTTREINKPQASEEVFIVREQLFRHKGKFYMLASHPEGKSWKDYIHSSTRYVSRLDNFPYSNLADVDHGHYTLRHKIKRLRGTSVGEAKGLGQEEQGHRVRLDKELEDIGLFIAAISYLLYASG
jgi:hypothetical protein